MRRLHYAQRAFRRTEDPLAKFEAATEEVSPGDQERFYRANMAELLGARAPATAGMDHP